MHDPKTVAIDIPRPWPRRYRHGNPGGRDRRWAFRYSWAKWYDLRPRTFMKFSTVAGVALYWPSLITIWHNEPSGHDSGEVCKHHIRWKDDDGKWQSKHKRAWRWHVHHWSIQFHPWQHFRRWAFTRCEWCGGRSVKADPVNISHQWHREPGPWWRGERGLFHQECSSIQSAHKVCLCGIGPWESILSGQPYGRCAHCAKYRGWRKESNPLGDDAQSLLASIPARGRDADKYAAARDLWDRARQETDHG